MQCVLARTGRAGYFHHMWSSVVYPNDWVVRFSAVVCLCTDSFVYFSFILNSVQWCISMWFP